jgi:hypothetical protein
MKFDAATLNLVSILVTFVGAGVSLLTWYYHREAPGLRGWAIALLLGGLGTLVFSQRTPSTQYAFILMADVLFVAGFASMWMSMRRFNDRRIGPGRMTLSVVGATGVFAVLSSLSWLYVDRVAAQSMLFSLFVSGLSAAAAWETWRAGRYDGLRSRALAVLALAGIAVIRLVRAVMVPFQVMGVIDQATGRIAQSYALYFTTVCVLIVTFGLVLMATERAERAHAALFDKRREGGSRTPSPEVPTR